MRYAYDEQTISHTILKVQYISESLFQSTYSAAFIASAFLFILYETRFRGEFCANIYFFYSFQLFAMRKLVREHRNITVRSYQTWRIRFEQHTVPKNYLLFEPV